ncbi:stalk domain-containing protein [Acetivibrio thermocellus]|uniref:stalk domain-containing protein n=1 Tax=Acetivibrio thermocellus TaxID=1515 RepID=UPI0021ADA85A|nr:stalk domain-containing protein [Acetivibrio thermocellus]UWV45867.1 stalk domain-containing protein [Acetivibrio thermocellus]
MKKILLLFIILISIVMLSFSVTFAGTNLNLYYNGKIHALKSTVVNKNDKYYLEADEMAQILGVKLKGDLSNQILTIDDGKTTSTYSARPLDYSIAAVKNYNPNIPQIINQKFYLPFEFIEEKFNLTVKYDEESGSIYFLENENLKTFKNITHGYLLNIPSQISIDLSGSHNAFNDNSVVLVDNNGEFSYTITCDKLDATSIAGMRLILNDFTSPDEEIFNAISDYAKSYFRAMQALYKNEFLFGGTDAALSESNMKIFADYTDILYGQPSDVVLYNTIKSDRLFSIEETHIMITVPIYSKMSIYTINIAGKRGFLTSENIVKINELVNALKIPDLPNNKNSLKILNDKKTVKDANLGIYPALSGGNIEYIEYQNPQQNYKIQYPSSFVLYLQNSIIESLDYTSFKIDYNNYVSISVETIQDDPDTCIKNKLNFIKSSPSVKTDSVEEGKTSLSGKTFHYIKYETKDVSDSYFIQDYYTIYNSRLYKIELNSKLIKPSEAIANEFLKIVKSIEFTKPEANNFSTETGFKKFLNEYEGYSFSYPESWELKNTSTDINFDRFSIVCPEYSGPLDICINESEFLIDASAGELLRLFGGNNAELLTNYAANYYAPYGTKNTKILNTSAKIENDIIYIYRLINFLGEGQRHKLGYSVDIIRDGKIYSLFLSVSDYLCTDGSLADKELSKAINTIVNSFTLEETEEYLKRKSAGETRNQKVVFLENCFKLILGRSTTLTHAKTLNSNDDILIQLSNCKEAGTYRLKFDYENKNFEIISVILQKDAVKSSEPKLKEMYGSKLIHRITPDYDNMTVTIRYSDGIDMPVLEKSYFIDVLPSEDGFDIFLARNYTYSELKSKCTSYLENYLLTNVEVQFPKEYNQPVKYSSKGRYEAHFINVFTRYGNKSGYFLLKIDPMADSVSAVGFVPTDETK